MQMSSAVYTLMLFRQLLIIEANIMKPDQTAPNLGSFCLQLGFHSVYRLGDNCHLSIRQLSRIAGKRGNLFRYLLILFLIFVLPFDKSIYNKPIDSKSIHT